MTFQELLDWKKQLAGNVKRIRESQDLSRLKLGKETKICISTLQELEKEDTFGHISFFNVMKVAKYFDVTLDELISGNPESDKDKDMFYKIKRLTPLKRSLIEAYIVVNKS